MRYQEYFGTLAFFIQAEKASSIRWTSNHSFTTIGVKGRSYFSGDTIAWFGVKWDGMLPDAHRRVPYSSKNDCRHRWLPKLLKPRKLEREITGNNGKKKFVAWNFFKLDLLRIRKCTWRNVSFTNRVYLKPSNGCKSSGRGPILWVLDGDEHCNQYTWQQFRSLEQFKAMQESVTKSQKRFDSLQSWVSKNGAWGLFWNEKNDGIFRSKRHESGGNESRKLKPIRNGWMISSENVQLSQEK